MFIKASPNSHGFVNARDTEDLWRDHFDYFYREYDEFIFVSPDFRRISIAEQAKLMRCNSLSPSIQMYLGGHIYS